MFTHTTHTHTASQIEITHDSMARVAIFLVQKAFLQSDSLLLSSSFCTQMWENLGMAISRLFFLENRGYKSLRIFIFEVHMHSPLMDVPCLHPTLSSPAENPPLLFKKDAYGLLFK